MRLRPLPYGQNDGLLVLLDATQPLVQVDATLALLRDALAWGPERAPVVWRGWVWQSMPRVVVCVTADN